MLRQSVAVSAVMLLALPGLAWALEEIETVSPERAAELGMIVRAKAAGAAAVGVELEFPTTGELTKFARVELSMREGKKTLFFTELKEEKSPAGHTIVRFLTDRSRVPQITLRVVTQDGLSRVARELAMKDFVDLGKAR